MRYEPITGKAKLVEKGYKNNKLPKEKPPLYEPIGKWEHPDEIWKAYLYLGPESLSNKKPEQQKSNFTDVFNAIKFVAKNLGYFLGIK